MVNLTALARNLGAHRQGHNWRCACPLGCGYSLSLANGEDGRLLAHCFGGCEFDRILAALVEFGLLDDDSFDYEPVWAIRSARADDADRIARAKCFYESLTPGPAIDTYLRSRSIGISSTVLRWAPYCPHRCGRTFPAMIAPVVDIDGELTAIHATFLRPDGNGKADLPRNLQRETRGIVRNGTIRLAKHDPDRELAVGEGIESVFSIMQRLELPGWSTVSADGLRTAELPPAVQRIVIAVDYDRGGAGQRNAAAAMRRWQGEGRVVRAVLPKIIGTDFNDLAERRRG